MDIGGRVSQGRQTQVDTNCGIRLNHCTATIIYLGGYELKPNYASYLIAFVYYLDSIVSSSKLFLDSLGDCVIKKKFYRFDYIQNQNNIINKIVYVFQCILH